MENLYVNNTRDLRGKAERQFSVYLIYPRNVISGTIIAWIRNFEPPCLLLCCVPFLKFPIPVKYKGPKKGH